MQLTLLKSSLPLVLAATLMSGQQGKSTLTQQPTPQNAAKQSSTLGAQPKAANVLKAQHRVVRKKNARASYRNGAKRDAYRPEFTKHSVEVINGSSTKQVVFNEEKKPGGNARGAPPQMKVEVVNGTASDTQYFYAGSGIRKVAVSKRPVVLGIQSSDTHVVGGNKHPVVTDIVDISAVKPGGAKTVNGGGPKVTTGVSPQPKRPDYQPETH